MLFPLIEECMRVNRPTARKMFKAGFSVYVVPCKVELDNNWSPYADIWNKTTLKDKINAFDRAVIDYKYNVCNAYEGYYPHYYVLKEDYTKYMDIVSRDLNISVSYNTNSGGLESAT